MPKASTRAKLIAAARQLTVSGDGALPTAGAVAAAAGVSRLTLYDHFGSYSGLLAALADSAAGPGPPGDGLRGAVEAACDTWASDPVLYRRLPARNPETLAATARALATSLAEADQLRPGCSLREAEDVIALILSFPAFDALHRDGRRSAGAVAAILLRMASSLLVSAPA